jgi:hypothetical protein
MNSFYVSRTNIKKVRGKTIESKPSNYYFIIKESDRAENGRTPLISYDFGLNKFKINQTFSVYITKRLTNISLLVMLRLLNGDSTFKS